MLKELVTPHAANVFVGKLGDILEKAVDKPLGYALSWGRLWSLWPVHIETACCSVEFGAASGPKYDVERFGIIEAFGSLRQCDLVVVQGTITRKMPKTVADFGFWRFKTAPPHAYKNIAMTSNITNMSMYA